MTEGDALALIQESKSLVFTTREFSALADIRISFASQMLRRLASKGRITRIYGGLWGDTRNPLFNAYKVVPFLTRPHPAAVSLLSALHLHGMIEQIPQVIYIVSTAPTRKKNTPVGDFSIHQIAPEFFTGYDYYRGGGDFLIASPEKALIDCLYLSARRGRRFISLPELTLPKGFSRRRALSYIKRIPYRNLRRAVQQRLEGVV